MTEYIEKYKKEFKKMFEDLKSKDTVYKQIPNLLTLSRAVGVIPVNILFFTGHIIPAIVLMGLIASTDFFDGMIARKYNLVSKFGADLDAICDKIMFAGFALPLMINNPYLVVSFVLEGLIAGINVVGRLKGLDTKTVFSGKVKTVSLSITLILGFLSQFYGMLESMVQLFTTITLGAQLVAVKDYIVACINMNKELKQEDVEKIIVSTANCSNDNDLELTVNKKISEVEYLRQERKFILASVEPGKVYTGKKRVRTKMQEKRTF